MTDITIEDGHGTLNWKVEWQALDGRCCLQWWETYKAAHTHYEHLISLDRTPQIWAKVE